jgi:hypothetical protein
VKHEKLTHAGLPGQFRCQPGVHVEVALCDSPHFETREWLPFGVVEEE